jgi:hypothetical protein
MEWRLPIVASEVEVLGSGGNARMKPQIGGGANFPVNRANLKRKRALE